MIPEHLLKRLRRDLQPPLGGPRDTVAHGPKSTTTTAIDKVHRPADGEVTERHRHVSSPITAKLLHDLRQKTASVQRRYTLTTPGTESSPGQAQRRSSRLGIAKQDVSPSPLPPIERREGPLREPSHQRETGRQPAAAQGLLFREVYRSNGLRATRPIVGRPPDLDGLGDTSEIKLPALTPKDLERVSVWLGEKSQMSSPGPADLKAQDMLFLDTETTGLSRGAGTLAFMIGLGRFAAKGDELEIDQILLRSPDREAEGLALLGTYLDDARALVTFNGASFDLPVLRNRAVLCRLPHLASRLQALPQLDLLPPSRRLFGDRLPDCRLGSLERSILGFTRRGDLPGAEVPLAYLRFLREGRLAVIQDVLNHNLLDIAVLPALLMKLVAYRFDPLRWAEDEAELLAAGRIHRRRDPALALACFERSLEQTRSADLRARAWIDLARLRRQTGDLAGAASAWESFRREFPHREEGWIELAKHHEHVTKDLQTAMRFAQGVPHHARADIKHRLVRLRRRLAKQHVSSEKHSSVPRHERQKVPPQL